MSAVTKVYGSPEIPKWIWFFFLHTPDVLLRLFVGVRSCTMTFSWCRRCRCRILQYVFLWNSRNILRTMKLHLTFHPQVHFLFLGELVLNDLTTSFRDVCLQPSTLDTTSNEWEFLKIFYLGELTLKNVCLI